MSGIEIRELDKDEYGLWDRLVDISPCGTIFHKSFWLDNCSELLNKKFKIYGCFKNDQLIGGCSLFIYKLKRILRMASSTAEMTPYGGLILLQSPGDKRRKQEQALGEIVDSLCSAFDNEHFHYVRIAGPPEFVDVRPFVWNGWDSDIHYTYYLNLENDIEQGFSKGLRKDIGKAVKEEIKVKKLTDPSILYDLFADTFKRQNLNPPVSKEFFHRITGLLESRNIGGMWTVETPSGEVICARVLLWDNKRAYAWAAGTHIAFRRAGANPFLLLAVLQDLKARGFKQIDLMQANTSEFAKYVSRFNPELVPYYSVKRTAGLAKIGKMVYEVTKKRGR